MKKAPPLDPVEIHRRVTLQAHERGLRNLARKVFLDRNARGMPDNVRAKIKAEARPQLRLAVNHARKSRDALRAGDFARFEHMRDVARMHLAFAAKEFRQPFMERARRTAEAGIVGSNATRDAATFEHGDLDDKIRACLAKGDRTRRYVKVWAIEAEVSKDTVYRRIRLAKIELKK